MGRKKNRTLADAYDKLERDYLTLKESLLRIQRDCLKIKTFAKPPQISNALAKCNSSTKPQPSLFEWEYLADVPHHHLAKQTH